MQHVPGTAAGHPLVVSISVLLVVVAGEFTFGRAAEPTLPTPPHQAEPWTPPQTGLPKFLVSATAALFEQGLADPRGCDYRTIPIMVGNVMGGNGQKVTTSGWVLPAVGDKAPRYAIAWSGLVYPLAGDTGPADLDVDVRALKSDADAARATTARESRSIQRIGFNGFGSNSEDSSIAVKSLHPIKVCLLLRLGRADLAEQFWAAGTGRTIDPKPAGAGLKLDLNNYGVSYLSLATDLAWYHFDRAICARHARRRPHRPGRRPGARRLGACSRYQG